MIALIDADILVYRVGFTTEDVSEKIAESRIDQFICNLLCFDLVDIFEWELYLTGKGNFREDLAVTAPYKGNRKQPKPKHYEAIRNRLVTHWKAKMIEGMEADDMLAIRQYELPKSIIVTLDKDLDQVTGWHYNFVKKDRYWIDYEEGTFLFYKQFLTGDVVDNIKGVKGIGAVKATKLLEGKTEAEMWEVVVEKLGMERAVENGHLLYMLRTREDSFTDYLYRQELNYYA